MVIYLPSQAADDLPVLDELTPREIVSELDKFVIGQADAKRAVAATVTAIVFDCTPDHSSQDWPSAATEATALSGSIWAW